MANICDNYIELLGTQSELMTVIQRLIACDEIEINSAELCTNIDGKSMAVVLGDTKWTPLSLDTVRSVLDGTKVEVYNTYSELGCNLFGKYATHDKTQDIGMCDLNQLHLYNDKGEFKPQLGECMDDFLAELFGLVDIVIDTSLPYVEVDLY